MKKTKRKWPFLVLAVILLPILVFALLCVSRINRHINDYDYDPELPKPAVGVDMKYDDAAADLYIRWCNLLDGIQISMWKAPEGIVKKPLRVSARDGFEIGGYILEPEGCEGEILPTMLYCHGGAFFLTMMSCQLDMGAYYADALHCRVVLPEYRSSLDAPYPTPVYDCYDTLQWIAESGETDTDRVMIYGDSAGGCLAAEVTLLCCDEGLLQPACQMLIYPVTDTSQEYSSLTEYEYATWPREANLRMWKVYLNGLAPTAEDYAVPMLREDFDGMPKAYVEAAEMDTLCDQDIAYADRLRAGSVDVTFRTVEGAYHGFDGPVENPFVQRVLKERVSWLRAVLDEIP